MQAWKDYQEKNKNRFLEELIALLRIPSVSARSEHKGDMLKCAEAFKTALESAGADRVAVYPTTGHPIVYGEKIIHPGGPTVLVYGHYDVQPPDPLELWHSGPFDPIVKDGRLYARGSADDKGQVYMHVKSFEMMMHTNTLACNVKFIIEGEEEVGSPNLGKFLEGHTDLLACDVVLISDTSMLSLDTPSLDVGLRGLSYIEVAVTGPDRDLHSGVYGGAVGNPITTLATMIASLHDNQGRITIPGFYNDVTEVPKTERAQLARAPFDEKAYEQDLGVKALWGEAGYSTNERTGIRPTLELNGIWGGYTGEGAKTVLPSKAFAKISCRLVPNQHSADITRLLLDHLQKIAPPYVKVEAHEHHGGDPYITPVNSIPFKAASAAMEATFGKTPIPLRGGGSIPITALFEKYLGVKIILLGFGLDSDNLHSPNEKFDLANFYKGIETIPYFHKFFAEMHGKGKDQD